MNLNDSLDVLKSNLKAMEKSIERLEQRIISLEYQREVERGNMPADVITD